MPRVVHVITTANFAGAERYVSDVARETATRGWESTVVGGAPERMQAALGRTVRWLPGAGPAQSLHSISRIGPQDVCHAHMTVAEAIAVAARPWHRAPVVSTRHFARHRGASLPGRLLAPWIASRLASEIAVSDFVARQLERPPAAVITNGVPPSPVLWQRSNRVVLVLQRLEREKDTFTALRAWHETRLVDEGWSLRIVGEGSERSILEAWAAAQDIRGVHFAGWAESVTEEHARAAILFAPATAEPFGLAVVEAMAAGVPVVASAAGGHLETVGLLPGASLFPAGDVAAAAAAVRSLKCDSVRAAMSELGRQLVMREFTLASHVDALLAAYSLPLQPSRGRRATPETHYR